MKQFLVVCLQLPHTSNKGKLFNTLLVFNKKLLNMYNIHRQPPCHACNNSLLLHTVIHKVYKEKVVLYHFEQLGTTLLFS